MQSPTSLYKLAEAYGGMPVMGAIPGSAAALAGVRYGDIIIELNGCSVRNVREYREARELRADVIDLRLIRAGQELSLRVDLSVGPVDKWTAIEWATEAQARVPVDGEGASEPS